FEPIAKSDPELVLAIVDLTESSTDPVAALATVRGEDSQLPALAYYAHTDDDVRRAALDAGFDLVVPRSRMMREGVELIRKLARA
ncbi:MAG: hypothetical protein ACRDKE_07930, partial [Solirubrobacterales bacterium]